MTKTTFTFILVYILWVVGGIAFTQATLPHGMSCKRWVDATCNNQCELRFGVYYGLHSYVFNPLGVNTHCHGECRITAKGEAKHYDTAKCVEKW